MRTVILCILLLVNIQCTVVVAESRFTQPYTLNVMLSDISALKGKYPIQSKVIGYSHYGQEIRAVKLGKGQRSILIVGAHHGREWLTSALLMEMIKTYAQEYQEGGSIGGYALRNLDEVAIWFVPMLNPDGVAIQQGEIPLVFTEQVFRMNQFSDNWKRWKANGIGIDLNRQYPAGWNKLMRLKRPQYQFYKGTAPLEAKEVQALVAFTKEIDPSVALSYHSSGQEIYWKYRTQKSHIQRDKHFAKKIAQLTGYQLANPSKKATGGGYTDWFITTYHRPALTIEICPLVENTSPPVETFSAEWTRNRAVGLAAVEMAIKLTKKNKK